MAGTWCPSIGAEGQRPIRDPLFFYHVPRTGGLSLYNALQWAFAAQGGSGKSIRYDLPDQAINGVQCQLVGSHRPFGVHERFAGSFRLLTMLRDPAERVASAYGYRRMRAGRAPTRSSFRRYAEAAPNRNGATKQLAGADLGTEATVEMYELAIENLGRFWIAATTAMVDDIIRAVLGLYGLPNVLMDRLNETTGPYRVEAGEWVRELNAFDARLFDHVRASPRLPYRLNPQTVVVTEVANDDRNKIAVGVLPTDRLDDCRAGGEKIELREMEVI